MALDFRVNAPVTPTQLSDVFRSAGLSRPVDDLPRLQRMLDGANLTVTAWDGDQLVGVARCLTDGSWCCYLSDLAVASTHQKQGIGRALVDRVREEIGEEVMLLLLSVPDAMEYYPRLGFEAQPRAWWITRKR